MRKPFVMQGLSQEFLEKIGYRKWEPPPCFETVKDPVMPLEPVKLAYSEIKIDCGWEARSQEGS